ncbi:MAG: hypothetical protein PF961_14550 [Planctomycetota bacterium]|jgi:hypothetical protein|nr:hypothetical protein [Planctomycetota bacterium]
MRSLILILIAVCAPLGLCAQSYNNDPELVALAHRMVNAVVDNDQQRFVGQFVGMTSYAKLEKMIPEGAEGPDKERWAKLRVELNDERLAAQKWFQAARTQMFNSSMPKNAIQIKGVNVTVNQLKGFKHIDSMSVDVAMTQAWTARLTFGSAVRLNDGWSFLTRPSPQVTSTRTNITGDTSETIFLGE